MPIDHIVALLIAERDRLNRAIEALQGPLKRRGRPSRNPGSIGTVAAMPRSARKGMSKAARKAQSARMKKYWAAKRKAKA
jgi:hypothetical protein